MKDSNWYKRQAAKLMSHFKDDIDIDIELVQHHPENEFFFFIRDCGTHAIGLRDLTDIENFGEHEPHLFGHKSVIDCIRAEVSAIDFSVAKTALAIYWYCPEQGYRATTYDHARQTIAAYLLTASNLAMKEGI